MAEPDVNSIPGLIRGLLHDTRDLIREEIALARTEIREEISAAQTVGIAFGSGALAALLGATLLCIAIGGAIAYLLHWPAWSGYGIVGVLLLAASFALVQYARGRLARIRALPKTSDTLKENMAWIQSKSSAK
jgi:hypothetical protein